MRGLNSNIYTHALWATSKVGDVSRSTMATASIDINFLLVVVQLLLIWSSDVEVNPGPLDQGERPYQ
jgi:hypothetical protein